MADTALSRKGGRKAGERREGKRERKGRGRERGRGEGNPRLETGVVREAEFGEVCDHTSVARESAREEKERRQGGG